MIRYSLPKNPTAQGLRIANPHEAYRRIRSFLDYCAENIQASNFQLDVVLDNFEINLPQALKLTKTIDAVLGANSRQVKSPLRTKLKGQLIHWAKNYHEDDYADALDCLDELRSTVPSKALMLAEIVVWYDFYLKKRYAGKTQQKCSMVAWAGKSSAISLRLLIDHDTLASNEFERIKDGLQENLPVELKDKYFKLM